MKYLFEFAEYLDSTAQDQSFGILGDIGEDSQFGEQTGYFKELIQYANGSGVDAFVFTDFTSTGCTAWTLVNDNWTSSVRGLPAVFYDRSFKNKTHKDKTSNTRFLLNLGCTPLNSPDFRKVSLDKYLTYETLINEDLGKLKIPYTQKYSKSNLIKFMSNYPESIIKPRFGSGGKGIIKVSKKEAGYLINYLDKSTTATDSNLVDRIDEVRKSMRSNGRTYIIQECITLPKYNGGVFDVRVIYQRDKAKKPVRTGMAVRLAAPSKITANLHQGGSKETLSTILKSIFNQDIDGPIAQSIRDSSQVIFDILDKKCGPIGEIGLDFLIDQSGEIHLLEVNSIPGRNLFKILPDIRKTAIERPVDYSKRLLKDLNKKSR